MIASVLANGGVAEHPTPDLVLEICVSRSGTDRLGVWAALEVPEVWVYAEGNVMWLMLSKGMYEPRERSAVLPELNRAAFNRFARQAIEEDQAQAVFDFADLIEQNCGLQRRIRNKK